jgi:hypothetical protein
MLFPMQPPDVVPQLTPTESPQKNSESAVFSLVLALLSFVFCLGPFASIPAIVLGVIANREIAKSSGRIGGGALSAAGIALGAFNLFACAAGFVGIFASAASKPHAPIPGPTAPPFSPTAIAPHLAPRHDPRTGPDPTEEGGQMSRIGEVTETRVGKVVIVDVPPTVRSFATELTTQRDKARTDHQKLVLFTTTEACRPCMSIAAVMPEPKMQAALDGVRLVRVETHDFEPDLERLGVPTDKIPGFFLLGPTLHPTDGITGAEWDDDTAENAAPVLGAFVRGTYTASRRKEPFTPSTAYGTPRPAPTML